MDRPPRRITVVAGITSASVLFLAILVLLLLRSLEGREPSHVAVIAGNENWVGAEVVVTGPSLPKPQYRAFIDHTNRYSVPFFLPPGQYQLRVRMGDAEVFAAEFELEEEREIEITLPRRVPSTAPASPP